MREDAVQDYLARAPVDWSVVWRLIARGDLVEVKLRGHSFYLRKLGDRRSFGSECLPASGIAEEAYGHAFGPRN